MQYYTIHVMTGSEDDFVHLLAPQVGRDRFVVPKKLMNLHRRGGIHKVMSPVFPGYVFFKSEDIKAELDTRWIIRRTLGFIRFLRQSSDPTPLSEKDLTLLRHFISFGEVADISKVIFDENDKIVILEGPLKGLEGRITKVDRRKGRARVILDMYESRFPIDLGFEVVERVKTGGADVHEEPGS
jgi:transcription termination/antitermination protein NusG